MADVGTIAGLVGIAAAINAVGTVQKDGKEKGFNVLFSSVGVFGAIITVGQFVDWTLATMLAVLFLLGTMLNKGAPVIEWYTTLLEGN